MHALAGISKPTRKPFPMLDVLDFVEEVVATLVAELALDEWDVLEVGGDKVNEAFVLEVDIYDALPGDATADEIADHVIQQGRLSRAAEPRDDVVCLRVERVAPWNDMGVSDDLMLVEDDAFKKVVVHLFRSFCRIHLAKV